MNKEKKLPSLELEQNKSYIDKVFTGKDEETTALKTSIKAYITAKNKLDKGTWEMAYALRNAHTHFKAGFETEEEFYTFMGMKQAYGTQLVKAVEFDLANNLEGSYSINKCQTLQATLKKGSNFTDFVEWVCEYYGMKADEIPTISDKSLRIIVKLFGEEHGLIEKKDTKKKATEPTGNTAEPTAETTGDTTETTGDTAEPTAEPTAETTAENKTEPTAETKAEVVADIISKTKTGIKREDILQMIKVYAKGKTDTETMMRAVDVMKWLKGQLNIKAKI